MLVKLVILAAGAVIVWWVFPRLRAWELAKGSKDPWICVLVAALIVMAFVALADASDDRRSDVSFVRHFAAMLLYFGFPVAALAASVATGFFVANRARKNWLGWMAGIVLFLAVMQGMPHLVVRLPGGKSVLRLMSDWSETASNREY